MLQQPRLPSHAMSAAAGNAGVSGNLRQHCVQWEEGETGEKLSTDQMAEGQRHPSVFIQILCNEGLKSPFRIAQHGWETGRVPASPCQRRSRLCMKYGVLRRQDGPCEVSGCLLPRSSSCCHPTPKPSNSEEVSTGVGCRLHLFQKHWEALWLEGLCVVLIN